jgi:hypothetical protein
MSCPVDATIVITSLSTELLRLCRSFIPSGVPVFVIDGRHGRYGIRAIKHVIEHAPCERAILLDEDAFIIDFVRLRRLLAWTAGTGTACIGMCDGGVLPIRTHNPNSLNPFFNIIDLSQVRRKWSEAECRSHIYDGHTMRDLWPPRHILTPGVSYRFDDFESYYCFYFWLRASGLKIEWLTGSTHTDGVSTLLNDRMGEPFLLHTWYGRTFGRDLAQTERIVRAALWVASQGDNARKSSACI